MADGGELGEVLPAFVSLGEEGEVGGVFTVGDFLFIFLPTCTEGGEVDLAAENGFYPGFFACLIEIDGAVEVPVVCHGDGGHA